ncbi:uncharacterized protein BT62DRAFT_1012875 [Guyanagaster necrorhizus]|uniref:Uncharacterized protein n=1 Tax=Guyanagaster necrorhizus TaxID=856835 RepID=A0A9P8AM23_9AGAR|nr:uncharacterized protein BT62DRAFT_1012875 [Guyanagaster necrorhizus MCA 3950]KAG7440226.1 hypothetical protein BT62DRAFT_1012875 [Guyanagaster necrorhizus MCA 3950]
MLTKICIRHHKRVSQSPPTPTLYLFAPRCTTIRAHGATRISETPWALPGLHAHVRLHKDLVSTSTLLRVGVLAVSLATSTISLSTAGTAGKRVASFLHMLFRAFPEIRALELTRTRHFQIPAVFWQPSRRSYPQFSPSYQPSALLKLPEDVKRGRRSRRPGTRKVVVFLTVSMNPNRSSAAAGWCLSGFPHKPLSVDFSNVVTWNRGFSLPPNNIDSTPLTTHKQGRQQRRICHTFGVDSLISSTAVRRSARGLEQTEVSVCWCKTLRRRSLYLAAASLSSPCDPPIFLRFGGNAVDGDETSVFSHAASKRRVCELWVRRRYEYHIFREVRGKHTATLAPASFNFISGPPQPALSPWARGKTNKKESSRLSHDNTLLLWGVLYLSFLTAAVLPTFQRHVMNTLSISMSEPKTPMHPSLSGPPDVNREPDDRPTAWKLSQSPLLPSRLEDEYFKGALKMITKPDSPYHQAVLASLFKQPPRPVRSFLYDHKADLPEHASLNGMVQNYLTAVFRLRGAVDMEPQLLMSITSTGDNKDHAVFINRCGDIVKLPSSLLVTFARLVARGGITRIKRFHNADVYRLQAVAGHPRPHKAAAFDIITLVLTSGPVAAGAEILAVADNFLDTFPDLAQMYEIHVSYLSLVDAVLGRLPAEHKSAIVEILNQPKSSSFQKRSLFLKKGLLRNTADELETRMWNRFFMKLDKLSSPPLDMIRPAIEEIKTAVKTASLATLAARRPATAYTRSRRRYKEDHEGDRAQGPPNTSTFPVSIHTNICIQVHIHYFTATFGLRLRLLDHFPNLHIGMTGVVCYASNSNTAELLKQMAATDNKRILLETGAPFMVPANVYGALEPKQSRLPFSHSLMIPWTAEFAADVMGEGWGWDKERVLNVSREGARMIPPNTSPSRLLKKTSTLTSSPELARVLEDDSDIEEAHCSIGRRETTPIPDVSVNAGGQYLAFVPVHEEQRTGKRIVYNKVLTPDQDSLSEPVLDLIRGYIKDLSADGNLEFILMALINCEPTDKVDIINAWVLHMLKAKLPPLPRKFCNIKDNRRDKNISGQNRLHSTMLSIANGFCETRNP